MCVSVCMRNKKAQNVKIGRLKSLKHKWSTNDNDSWYNKKHSKTKNRTVD